MQFSMANKGTFIYLFLLMVFSLLLVIITLFSLLPMMIVYVCSNSLSTTNDDSNFLFPPSPPLSLSLSLSLPLSHTHTSTQTHGRRNILTPMVKYIGFWFCVGAHLPFHGLKWKNSHACDEFWVCFAELIKKFMFLFHLIISAFHRVPPDWWVFA